MRRWAVLVLVVVLAAAPVVAAGHGQPHGQGHGPPDHAQDQGDQGHGHNRSGPPDHQGHGDQGHRHNGSGPERNHTGSPANAGSPNGSAPGHNNTQNASHAPHARPPPAHAHGNASGSPPGHARDTGRAPAHTGRGDPGPPAHSLAGNRSANSPAWQGCAPGGNVSLDGCPPGLLVAADRSNASAPPLEAVRAAVSASPPSADPNGNVTGDVDDGLDGGAGTNVPDRRVDLTDYARGPVSETILVAVTFILASAGLLVFGTVRGFSRRRSGPVAMTKAERQEAYRLAQEAAASGLEGWSWMRPETFDGLKEVDAETVAFWTGDDVDAVARWQGEAPREEEAILVRQRASTPPARPVRA